MSQPPPSGKLAATTPPRMVLHLGAPKCGSSSVQAALSRQPELRARDGRRLAYICATTDGVLAGEVLRENAARSAFGYAATPNLRADVAAPVLAHLEAGARDLIARGVVPILSSEGWLMQANRFRKSGVLERLGGGVHVVFAVRPPIDWLNAAWWQWGAWSDVSCDRFLARNLAHVRWPKLAADWAAVPGVTAVHLRLADGDAVRGLFDLLDVPPPETPPVNTSLPPDLLSFLLRNRYLRPGPSSPEIEFRLARALATAPRREGLTPLWALSPAQAEESWKALRFHPRQLGPLLPKADRDRMRGDPRWFGPAAYAGRAPCLPDAFEAPEALTSLHDWLADAAGAPLAAAPFAGPGDADAAIRSLVLRLASPPARRPGGLLDRLRRGR
ncbi:hypothetical protein [Jannaschia formosa]|uniref:hypothetical protein n=1 Tax=Jannaschia formosa TaxID=2259592 RepID=UPI001074BB70|nr:hypothetical protein [Jannaschia formosa]TFL18172.1 hypothetical protein DR046_10485 [Jannaschia formosa]